MAIRQLAAAAVELRSLHRRGAPLVLVNVWDAASAAHVAAAGAPAVATSSAAIAASLGEPDDSTADLDAVFGAVARIAGAVAVPVTADLFDGYGLPAAELVERLLAAGVVGCNLEDSDHASPGTLAPAEAVAERLAAVRDTARVAGVDVVLNARIDAFLHDGPDATDEVIARARAYLAAGADCVYPVGLRDPDVVRAVVATIDGHVNANAEDHASVAAVAAAGASRVSIGPMAFRRAYEVVDRLAAELLPAATSPA